MEITLTKDWTDILQAFLAPAIAFFAAVIALREFRISRTRLRHEIFDRRLALFDGAKRFVLAALDLANVQSEDPVKAAKFQGANRNFLALRTEATFLFDGDIPLYLELLHSKAVQYWVVQRRARTGNPHRDVAALADSDIELSEWLHVQLAQIEIRFAPYLKIERSLWSWAMSEFRIANNPELQALRKVAWAQSAQVARRKR